MQAWQSWSAWDLCASHCSCGPETSPCAPSPPRCPPQVKWWLIALIAFLIGVPASWWGWYKSIYRLAQTDGATYAFFRTLILIFLNIAWCVWMVLAIDGLGDFSAGARWLPASQYGHMGCWAGMLGVGLLGGGDHCDPR